MKLLLFLAAAAAWAQPPCVLRGVVSDESTGKPLAGVRLFLAPRSDRPLPSILKTSNPEGAFCFDDVPRGNYVLQTMRSGYLESTYGDGLVLAIGSKEPLPPLDVRLIRRAVVSGVVLDANGEPVPHASVRVYRTRAAVADEADIEGQETDDRGAFRFGSLKPGTYYLGVTVMDRVPIQFHIPFLDADGKPRQEGYGQALLSAPIVVQPGKDVSGVLLSVPKTELRHVSGTAGPGGGIIRVSVPGKMSTAFPVGPDGKFFRAGLEPGRYTLEWVTGSQTRTKKEIDLTSGDLDGIVLTPDAVPVTYFDLTVEVRTEGKGKPITPSADSFVFLQRTDGDFGATAQFGDDGIRFRRLVPGTYMLTSVWGNEDYYVKRTILGGQVVNDRTLDMRQGNPGVLQLVFAANSAAIEGRVLHDGVFSKAVTVLLFDESGNGRHQTVADQNGNFHFDQVTPGKHRLYAVEAFEPSRWTPEIKKSLEPKSLAIELGDDEKKQVELQLIQQ